MDNKTLKEHLKTLTELHGPSGFENAIQDYVRDQWTELVDEFETDGIGSLVGIKRGTGPEPRKRIMLSAHMDEIGLMVAEIKDGYIRTVKLGGVDERILLAKPVLVHCRLTGETLPGIVAAPPPHITNQTGGAKDYLPLKDLWIDLGLPADEVVAKVEIGDFITMDAPLIELMGNKVAGKAMDDRASVASVTACLHYLQSRTHTWDVYAVASVQEEVGLRGAITAAYHTNPDLAIAIDVTFAQQPGVGGDDYMKLGDGVAIGLGPNFHNGLVADIKKVAGQIEMELFDEVMAGNSGTDAWAIQVSREGVPTVLFSIPIRNMHTPVEMVNLKDIDRTGRLMAEFIAWLSDDYLDTIEWKSDEDDTDGDDA